MVGRPAGPSKSAKAGSDRSVGAGRIVAVASGIGSSRSLTLSDVLGRVGRGRSDGGRRRASGRNDTATLAQPRPLPRRATAGGRPGPSVCRRPRRSTRNPARRSARAGSSSSIGLPAPRPSWGAARSASLPLRPMAAPAAIRESTRGRTIQADRDGSGSTGSSPGRLDRRGGRPGRWSPERTNRQRRPPTSRPLLRSNRATGVTLMRRMCGSSSTSMGVGWRAFITAGMLVPPTKSPACAAIESARHLRSTCRDPQLTQTRIASSNETIPTRAQAPRSALRSSRYDSRSRPSVIGSRSDSRKGYASGNDGSVPA